MHHTKHKGNIAETLVQLSLQRLGYFVFTATQDHSPIDLVAYNHESNVTLRIQVKHRENGFVPKYTSWADGNGSHRRPIDPRHIDYIAMVYEEKVCFVPPEMMGKTIRFEEPNAATPYFWWEDFKIGKPIPNKRKRTGGYQINRSKTIMSTRRADRPSRDELAKLLQENTYREIGRRFGVSDNAVRKWERAYRA